MFAHEPGYDHVLVDQSAPVSVSRWRIFLFTRLRCCGLAKKTLGLLFHERLAALPEMYWFKWTYFHERALPFPQRCCLGRGAAKVVGRRDGEQRIPAAGSGGIVPRCWVEADGGGNGSSERQCRSWKRAVPIFSSSAKNRSWKRSLNVIQFFKPCRFPTVARSSAAVRLH